jgi:processive 1,2-diacylglycerol beta-glucosyltransferase
LDAVSADPRQPTALVMMGGYGSGPLRKVVESFKDARGVRLEIVAGRNPAVKRRLERLVRKLGLDAKVHCFVPHDELIPMMAGASFVVTKPGAVTVTEAGALSKPMILVGPLQGQEVGNAAAVVEGGAGVHVRDPRLAGRAAAELLSDLARLKRLGRGARRLANPHSARDIAEDLFRLAVQPASGDGAAGGAKRR